MATITDYVPDEDAPPGGPSVYGAKRCPKCDGTIYIERELRARATRVLCPTCDRQGEIKDDELGRIDLSARLNSIFLPEKALEDAAQAPGEGLTARFQSRSLTERQFRDVSMMKSACASLAGLIEAKVPAGRERDIAIERLEEVAMWCSKGLAFK